MSDLEQEVERLQRQTHEDFITILELRAELERERGANASLMAAIQEEHADDQSLH